MARNNKHIKGDRAELIAQEFFIEKGFYVFNNISQHGPVDMAVMDKEPNDLEHQIDTLKAGKVALYADVKKYRDENEALQKQKIYLQKQCRRAGAAILAQETLNKELKKDIDRLSEENENLLTMYNGKR